MNRPTEMSAVRESIKRARENAAFVARLHDRHESEAPLYARLASIDRCSGWNDQPTTGDS